MFTTETQRAQTLPMGVENNNALPIRGQRRQSVVTPASTTWTCPYPTPLDSTASAAMDNSFSYELPTMDWRPSQYSEYQPYPSPYPSPAPSFVSRPHHSHSSSVSNAGPTASPTLSSQTSSPHVTSHAHSHSHSAPIDPALQEPYQHSWSHAPGPQSPVIGNQVQSPVAAANPYATPPPSAKPTSSMSRQELEQELARLKTRVNELEVIHHWLELKGMRLEADVQHHSRLPPPISTQNHGHHNHHLPHPNNTTITSVPNIASSLHTPPGSDSSGDQQPIVIGGVAPTEDFASNWRARTDARIKRFCALNRAGNALCAWHDSRRERRAYPPRQAPPGYLNCGCTNEEALFEESLARHGVGSYHPGEMVRMDPALRNPLLKLLQKRFGYVDGDFERDPVTGLWVDGEGAELWESVLPPGKPPVSGGRKRGETK